ncbi:MAG: flagellar motor switch phosphatase FliY [Oscillospiraceae bacterium]
MKPDDIDVFSDLQKDAIGEILNISIGSSATAVSTMLQKRTDITTPRVEVVRAENFEITSMEPAVAVEIEYVEGIEGKNVFVLRRCDVKAIVETMMMTEIPDDEFELDEMNMSAVCEIMNQMMGASATALASLLERPVNISTPVAYEIENVTDLQERYFQDQEVAVVVRFNLTVEDVIDSEFLSVMPVNLAKELVQAFMPGFDEAEMEQEEQVVAEVQAAPQPAEPTPTPTPQPTPQVAPQMTPEQQMYQQQMAPPTYQAPPVQQIPAMYQDMPMQQGMPMYQAPPMYMQQPMQPRVIQVQAPPQEAFNIASLNLPDAQTKNLDMLMNVPMEISVEIGRTKKPIKEIVAFAQGTLVVLDKLAGEQVDLYVNNKCIAKGDVVVIDDSFGVRITKILDKNDILSSK